MKFKTHQIIKKYIKIEKKNISNQTKRKKKKKPKSSKFFYDFITMATKGSKF